MTDDKPPMERLWRVAEEVIDPFDDPGRPVLPQTAWGFIWYFATQARGPFIIMLVMGGLVGAVDAGLYWSVGWLIDLLDNSDPARLVSENWPQLLTLLLLVVVVRAVIVVSAAMMEQQVIAPRFYALVRWQAFRRVIEQPYGFFQNDFAGRIATKVMQGGEATGEFIVSILQALWSFATFVILTTTILATLDARMVGVLAVWAVGYVLIARYLLPPLRIAGRRRANERSVLNGRMVDAFTNIISVKLFDARRREHGFVREGMQRLLDANVALARLITSVRAAVALLNGAMMAAIGYIAVTAWIAGDITSGAIAAALGLVLRLNQMSGWMMFNINGLIRQYATVQDAIGTISVEPSLADRSDAVDMGRARGDIEFDNVVFHHGKEGGLFEALSLRIRPGEKVGLVGPSGAGKSTFVNLLLRLYDVEGGQIRLDGLDIASVTQASLREQFGVVTQEPVLMHRSLRDNIAYGRPDASEDEIVHAAKRARAHDFITGVRDPNGREGYDAHVGERGIKLSGGQRQRVAIARVMLKDAPILILDEATSALDSEIEAVIQENLAALMENKTVIAIAHRLSTISAMDRLIVMDEGRIVEEGTHEELVARNGLYARLWQRQSGGFIAAAEATEAAE